MDDYPLPTDPRATRVRFGPDLRVSAAVFLLGLVAVVVAAAASDGPSRLIFALAAVVLIGYAAGDAICWPRLTVDATGLRVRAPLDRVDLAWPDVTEVRADTRRRHGIRSVTLEIDADERLIVFSRRSLGADPETVADLIRALAPRH